MVVTPAEVQPLPVFVLPSSLRGQATSEPAGFRPKLAAATSRSKPQRSRTWLLKELHLGSPLTRFTKLLTAFRLREKSYLMASSCHSRIPRPQAQQKLLPFRQRA